MKKIVSILFLFTFLCANTEIGQLLKLPNLIEHFIEHHDHKDEKSISFLDFVKSHYNDNQKHTDTDKHDEHQNLPFKTISGSASNIIAFENQTEIIFHNPVSISINIVTPFSKQFYTSDVFACIWLPPKLS
ncbi:hypothetical protein [Flavobacterium sp.]|uniref:hypothetical protein n=1 Tax=Flavobacterium sp. TaxID=239 RepID=UPI0037502861